MFGSNEEKRGEMRDFNYKYVWFTKKWERFYNQFIIISLQLHKSTIGFRQLLTHITATSS
jgi:hypothetical protein